jgi:hypothetical protein
MGKWAGGALGRHRIEVVVRVRECSSDCRQRVACLRLSGKMVHLRCVAPRHSTCTWSWPLLNQLHMTQKIDKRATLISEEQA